MKSDLIQPTHLARKAIVYIRQSTPAQVVSNQESLRLQYALMQRARDLGWREADVDVIDADLGLSGASAVQRQGFKELTARVSLSEVGLILSLDVTRLARNCSDWYPLLDICGLRNCLIADRDGVYDPGSPNGRLLLGLKGTISELELHTIRSRLTAGLLAKAARGELALTLPVGLTRVSGDLVVKDADVEVQERLRLVFQSFLRLRTAAKVMRMFNAQGLDLPRRGRHGDLRWTRASVSAVIAILKNPAYAGAFVYGRRQASAVTSRTGRAMKRPRPMQEWRFVVKDRYPAYIEWATYEKICSILSDNRAEYMRNKTREPRATATCCCTASSGAAGADTRCSCATRAAANTCAIICTLSAQLRCASISAPTWSIMPSRRPSWPRWLRPRSRPCHRLIAPGRKRTGSFGVPPSSRSSANAIRPRWPSGSTTRSIPITGWWRANLSAAGKRL